MKHPMRLVSFGIFSMFLLVGLYVVAGQQLGEVAADHTIYVTVKVKADLSDKEWDNLEEQLLRKGDISIEYTCRESGIMALRLLEATLTQKGDVQTLFLNRVSGLLSSSQLSFLDIHFHAAKTSGNC